MFPPPILQKVKPRCVNLNRFLFSSVLFSLTLGATSGISFAASPASPLQPSSQLRVVTQLLPPAKDGTAYQVSLVAMGGVKPYTWSVTSGALPEGLTLGAETGVLSGVTNQVGDFSFQVTVKDSESNRANNTLSMIALSNVTTAEEAVTPTSFGFQCGIGDTEECEGSGWDQIVWPDTQAQPGTIRLHDSGTSWSDLDQGNGVYSWTVLDNWLDLIAQHQPVAAIETFTWVPCYLVPTNKCLAPPTAPSGTNTPPTDLTANGSAAFNAFVTAFAQHCSPHNNCVKNLIKSYEMWNEWDLQFHWTGSMQQVYQMVKPAVAIIRANVPHAVILMPSSTAYSDTGLGYLTDFRNWMNYETANGRISDWVNWHVYLTTGHTTTNTPEDQWNKFIVGYLNTQASTPGWETTPWTNTETNFNGTPPPGLNYSCPSAQFTPADCTGQIVRWQLLHASNSGSGLAWYKWMYTIGQNPQYETAYKFMMQYLAGGKFPTPCSSNNATTPVWTCNFKEGNGATALWVWTTSESGTNFVVPQGFTDYMNLTGAKTTVVAGQQITISVEPVMLQAAGQ